METVSNVIIAGSESFCNRLYDIVDTVIPGVEQISYAPKEESLFSQLKKKKYQILFVEEGFIKQPVSRVRLSKIKTTVPALKIILFSPAKKGKEIKEADFVLPEKFSKKELAAILLKKEAPQAAINESALKLIRDALKDGFHIRHLQIFNGIVSNLENKDIADNIDLGERTVETYRKGLFTTARMKGVFNLALYGVKRGWIDIDGNKFLDDDLLKDFLLKKIR